MRALSNGEQADFMTNTFPAAQLARIGYNHAYRFDGDQVELEADVRFLDAGAAIARPWALQLWASAEGFGAGLGQGVKVAELPLSAGGECISVSGKAMAMPPASHAGLRMALALVSWSQNGEPELADLAEYPLAAKFQQPCFEGEVQAKFGPSSVDLAVGAIANPRAEDNLSGSLALELWALDSPYGGGAWQGERLAGVEVGVLGGAQRWRDLSWTLPIETPKAEKHLTLMLREWTAAGYVTRDFRSLAQMPVTAPDSMVEPAAKSADKKTAAPVLSKPKAEARVEAKTEAKTEAKAGVVTRVNVNTADLAEIDAIKGLTSKVAKAIVAGRPYGSLEDLCRVKGMGPKLLEKIRAGITL